MKGYKYGRKISLEKRQEIVDWYLDGYSTKIIAKEYGIEYSTIFHYVKDVKHLRKPRVPPNTPLGKKPKTMEIKKDVIIKRRPQKSYQQYLDEKKKNDFTIKEIHISR